MRELLERVRVVLCRPSHPGNIGASARAMKTMGIADLRLVAPERFPAPEAQWMAAHAGDVLARARLHPQLGDALADCVAAFALSARPREWSPQVLEPRAAAEVALERAASGPVAFVFGAESAGLTNEELFACQFLIHIPTDADNRSLNLAQAVQVICYEVLVATGAHAPKMRGEKLATVRDLEGLYAHLEEAATGSDFYDPGSGSRLPERLRRLFSRVPAIEREEVNILRGLLNALQKVRRQ
jgi:tRNA/rRNA methyltransferase